MLFRVASGLRWTLPLLALSTLLPALAPAQRVVAWGGNSEGQCDVPVGLTGADRTAGGFAHSLALLLDGTVAAWGDNSAGQCSVPAGLSGALQVEAGSYHSLALRSDGTVAVWGAIWAPVPTGLSQAIQIAAGNYHSLALRSDGTVAAWGQNEKGQCDVPADLTGVVGMGTGAYHSFAIRSDGTVAAWGDNASGQCDVPAGLTGVFQVEGGRLHSLALRSNGTVVGWGDNTSGQCNVPADLKGVTQVAAGRFHSLALQADGTVVAWGSNTSGQCDVPAGLTGVLQVKAGVFHSLAVVAAAHALVEPKIVYSGDAALGKVKIAQPVPGDIAVGLASSDPMLHVPNSVTIPAGQIEASFPITTDSFFGPDRTVTVQTVFNGTPTVPAKVTLKGRRVNLVFSSPQVVGGSNVARTLRVELETPTATDVTLSLSSSDTCLEVPPSVTVPAGQTVVTVPVVHRTTGIDTNVKVTATLANQPVATATLRVKGFTGSFSLETPSVLGGRTASGGVYLNAVLREPLTFSLSSDSADATVPSQVTIQAGARWASVPVTTRAVAAPQTVRVTATALGQGLSGRLFLQPAPGVAAVTVAGSVYGNGKTTGTVKLKRPAPVGGVVVKLSSSDPALTVPASVKVAEGQTTATFPVQTADVASATAVTLTATTADSATNVVTVKPLVPVSLALSATAVAGGGSLTGTVTLAAKAAVDTVVTLASSDAATAKVPTQVVVKAGKSSATFKVTTVKVIKAKSVKITVSRHGVAMSKTVKVTL